MKAGGIPNTNDGLSRTADYVKKIMAGANEIGGVLHPGVAAEAAGRRNDVRGVAGLSVADASVMPRQIAANTNAATMMIAEKASDLILARRRSLARVA